MDEINRAWARDLWRDAKKEKMTWMEFVAWLNSIVNPGPEGDGETRFIGEKK